MSQNVLITADRQSFSLEIKPEGYERGGTPLRNGALRYGEAPSYSSAPVLALLFQYAIVGLVNGGIASVKYPILTGYFQLEGHILNSGSALMTIGWSLKVFFGLITDCVPIFGYRRKPYIFFGWLCTGITLVIIAVRPPGDAYPSSTATTNGSTFALLCAVACFFFILADVAQDAMVVEFAQCEPELVRGRLQSLVYGTRALSMAMISMISGFCLNSRRMAGSFDWDITINGFFALLAVPVLCNIGVVWFFIRDSKKSAIPLVEYLEIFWNLAQKRAVWQIMIFQFMFALFTSSIGTTAAAYVSLFWAKVETLNLAIMHVIGYLIFAGVVFAIGHIGTQWNWRIVLVLTTLSANAIDAVVQFLTIFDVVRNQWFYLGVPLTEELPKAINFVIGTFVIVELAEEGNEGVMYGLLTTVGNLPSIFGTLLTNLIDAQLNYSKESIHQDTQDTRIAVAWSYVVLYGTTIVGCFWVLLLPSQKSGILKLKERGGEYPKLASLIFFVFFIVFTTSITGTMTSMFESTSCLIIAGGRGCLGAAPQWYLIGILLPPATLMFFSLARLMKNIFVLT